MPDAYDPATKLTADATDEQILARWRRAHRVDSDDDGGACERAGLLIAREYAAACVKKNTEDITKIKAALAGVRAERAAARTPATDAPVAPVRWFDLPAVAEANRALNCLYIATGEHAAHDVTEKVHAAFRAIALDALCDAVAASAPPQLDDAWKEGLDAEAIAELEWFREHLERHQQGHPACRFCNEKFPNSEHPAPPQPTEGTP